MATGQQPGWYPDPWGQPGQRWWDGREWTGQVAGVAPAAPVHPSGSVTNVRWLVLGGAAAVVLGSLLPWAQVTAPFIGTVSVAGTDGDGILTLLGALAFGGLALLALRARRSRGAMIGSLAVAVLVAAIAVIDMVDVARLADVGDDVAVRASVGIGLWVVLLGAAAASVGCVLFLKAGRSAGPPSDRDAAA